MQLCLDWSKKFDLFVNNGNTFPSDNEIILSANLIKEELNEYIGHIETIIGKSEITKEDLIALADDLADIQWVTHRAIQIWGFDNKILEQIIYESNMSKSIPFEAIESEIEIAKNKGLEVIAIKIEGENNKYRLKATDNENNGAKRNKLIKPSNTYFKEPDFSNVINEGRKR